MMTRLILGLVMALGMAAVCSAANEATLTFSPVTEYTDGTSIPAGKTVTYDVYQGLKGAARAKVGSIVSGGKLTTGLLTGNEYCWHVQAVVDATSSAPSNEACKRFQGIPDTVTITVT